MSLSFFDKKEVFAQVCKGSRKDLRGAVEAAMKAQKSWAQRSAYNRGQILYRMAEMLESRKQDFLFLLIQVLKHKCLIQSLPNFILHLI